MLKTPTFLAIMAFVMLFSCQSNNESINEIDQLQSFSDLEFVVSTKNMTGLAAKNTTTACYSTPLIAGQNYEAGRVDVEIVDGYVYISYITNDEWIIKLTHLYAGDREGIPETKKGNPKPGVFEKKMDYEANVISDFEVEYKIEANAFDACFSIAAHAEVAKIDSNGSIIQRETGWAFGEQFEGNSWAMLFDFCKSDCSGAATK